MITETSPAEYLVAAQIYAVVQAAYGLEASRIGCSDFPPLRESLDDLRQSSDAFLAFKTATQIIGVLSFDQRPDAMTLTRLVVCPAHQRHGIATALLRALEQRIPEGTILAVSTALANEPALHLYQGLGYNEIGVSDSPEGIRLIHFAKSNARTDKR